MGIALGVKNLLSKENLEQEFERICRVIHDTRPTAQNLFWAIGRMREVYAKHKHGTLEDLKSELRDEAVLMHEEDIQINRRMGEHGQELLKSDMSVLTHCNAGALATAGRPGDFLGKKPPTTFHPLVHRQHSRLPRGRSAARHTPRLDWRHM